MRQYVASLRTTAWRTAGARYNAARRLKQREAFSTFSLAALSALSIAAAVAQRIYSPVSGTALDNYLTALSIALGVFLLTLSLLEWGAAHGARAEALHRNAEDLTYFQQMLAQRLASMDGGRIYTDEEIDRFRVEYDTIKSKCTHNHAPIDHELFEVQHRTSPEFSDAQGHPRIGRSAAFWVRVRWNASTSWFLGLVWVAVGCALGAAWYIPKG